METLYGTITPSGPSFDAATQTAVNVFYRSAKDGSRFKMTLSMVRPEKTAQQVKGIFGGWISRIVKHMTEHGLTIPLQLGTRTLEAIPNKANVMMLLYTACGNGKTLSGMDVSEASEFMEKIPDFVGLNSDFFHGLVLPELDKDWRSKP